FPRRYSASAPATSPQDLFSMLSSQLPSISSADRETYRMHLVSLLQALDAQLPQSPQSSEILGKDGGELDFEMTTKGGVQSGIGTANTGFPMLRDYSREKSEEKGKNGEGEGKSQGVSTGVDRAL
ncbi:hypothetical protein GP486_008547, partial [Trichoglossum hirsutum]